MLSYNITFNIDDEIHAEAISYLRDVFIPSAISCGKLSKPQIWSISSISGECFGNNYALQFNVDTMESLADWIQTKEPRLMEDLREKFGETIVVFPTLLSAIQF
ncbi:MAG: DUF4286 family protein [Tannerellaceae bacterium]|nr:DUF4286 family protein [Tannerellaceae bacterium]